VITGNTADYGGGIAGSNGWIEQCIISGNTAQYGGGGIASCHGVIKQCVIAQNTAGQEGGGIDWGSSPGELRNCTIAGNTLTGSSQGGGIMNYTGKVINCIIRQNTAAEIAASSVPSYSCIAGGTGNGNIDADPVFADAGNGDYHLKSVAGRWDPAGQTWVLDGETSPCIDAGNPGSILEEETADANNVRVNLGAYGGSAEASKTPPGGSLLSDITNDGVVNTEDLLILRSLWLQSGFEQPADFTRDGCIKTDDLLRLRSEWLKTVNR